MARRASLRMAKALLCGFCEFALDLKKDGRRHMVKPEWGTKRTCPKCAARFYDLGNETPVTCIECGVTWDPEPILKSKQPLPYEAVAPAQQKDGKEGDSEEVDNDLDIDIDDDDDSPDNDVDLGGDDDLGVEASDDGKDDDN